jgi:5-methylcytosine-specific restriction endonuclease McrA
VSPIRLCAQPRCPNPATAKGRCDAHRKALERDRSRARRDTSHKSFYDTKKWRLAARHKKFLNPICERCDEALSQEVHHDPPLKVLLATGRNPYDPAVLVALCKPCHSTVTLLEQRTG